jgi:hypothetical protein
MSHSDLAGQLVVYFICGHKETTIINRAVHAKESKLLVSGQDIRIFNTTSLNHVSAIRFALYQML